MTEDLMMPENQDQNLPAMLAALEMARQTILSLPDGSSSARDRVLKALTNALTYAGGTPQIGDVMPAGHPYAGWTYMGPDEETNEDFYAAPGDEPGTFSLKQAVEYAESIDARVPTESQRDKMYRNREKGALKGTFKISATDSTCEGLYYYLAVKPDYQTFETGQRFDDGHRLNGYRMSGGGSLRCVR